ncbi:uncharacterized protein CEXT_203981 [Caerostris extrusa]|uniref:Uncharacterized protein n=1 Tax=Caerostris extrusa TaxID=172846 RepID=A0AAV4UF56_CAEEX|nr:uncharacterized protein CEXT_203981 [Caerostris extrusa]
MDFTSTKNLITKTIVESLNGEDNQKIDSISLSATVSELPCNGKVTNCDTFSQNSLHLMFTEQSMGGEKSESSVFLCLPTSPMLPASEIKRRRNRRIDTNSKADNELQLLVQSVQDSISSQFQGVESDELSDVGVNSIPVTALTCDTTSDSFCDKLSTEDNIDMLLDDRACLQEDQKLNKNIETAKDIVCCDDQYIMNQEKQVIAEVCENMKKSDDASVYHTDAQPTQHFNTELYDSNNIVSVKHYEEGGMLKSSSDLQCGISEQIRTKSMGEDTEIFFKSQEHNTHVLNEPVSQSSNSLCNIVTNELRISNKKSLNSDEEWTETKKECTTNLLIAEEEMKQKGNDIEQITSSVVKVTFGKNQCNDVKADSDSNLSDNIEDYEELLEIPVIVTDDKDKSEKLNECNLDLKELESSPAVSSKPSTLSSKTPFKNSKRSFKAEDASKLLKKDKKTNECVIDSLVSVLNDPMLVKDSHTFENKDSFSSSFVDNNNGKNQLKNGEVFSIDVINIGVSNNSLELPNNNTPVHQASFKKRGRKSKKPLLV